MKYLKKDILVKLVPTFIKLALLQMFTTVKGKIIYRHFWQEFLFREVQIRDHATNIFHQNIISDRSNILLKHERKVFEKRGDVIPKE